MKIPPFIATLGMMLILKGLSLVISGTKPIYFNDTPSFPPLSTGFADRRVSFPALPVPNGVVILFVLALIILGFGKPHGAGALLLCACKRRGRAALGRQRRRLEGGDLRARPADLRHRRSADRPCG